jgi:hypothetical protein
LFVESADNLDLLVVVHVMVAVVVASIVANPEIGIARVVVI